MALLKILLGALTFVALFHVVRLWMTYSQYRALKKQGVVFDDKGAIFQPNDFAAIDKQRKLHPHFIPMHQWVKSWACPGSDKLPPLAGFRFPGASVLVLNNCRYLEDLYVKQN